MRKDENFFDESPWESASNPFATPRTVPGGWDLTGLTDHGNLAGQAGSSQVNDSASPNSGESRSGSQVNKFPEPRTIPALWDTSTFTTDR